MGITLSVVILAYNRKEEVLKTVKICLENEYIKNNGEIIVVDNCSGDETFEALEKAYINAIKIVRTEKNIGVAGWNRGFEIANGKYILVLDDDSHPKNDIEKAISYLEINENVGVLALNIIGGAYTTESYPDFLEWIAFIGCGAIIRKEVFDKIGGFSEWLFIYTHEYEYGIRVIDAGFKIILFKDSTIIQRASALNRTNKRVVTFSTRNELLIVDKYFINHIWLSLFKCKLKLIEYYAAEEGISSLPYVFDGFRKFREVRKTIAANRVSPGTQKYFEDQFLPKYSIFLLLLFYVPRSLVRGLRHTLKDNSKK
jgi:GT2 family glycosyltransferase